MELNTRNGQRLLASLNKIANELERQNDLKEKELSLNNSQSCCEKKTEETAKYVGLNHYNERLYKCPECGGRVIVNNPQSVGIIRCIDDLGRIVIPKELRRMAKIECGKSMEEFVLDDGSILLKKHNYEG